MSIEAEASQTECSAGRAVQQHEITTERETACDGRRNQLVMRRALHASE